MANGVAMTLLFTTLFAAASAWGQNVATGKQIAERWCASCHVVGPGQKNVPNDAVPSFPSIAQMSSTTKMSLAAFLSTSHPPMPDIVLSRSEIADVSAYILSLRKQK
jgi:mono/diheme cytochrome c family protein